jgi:hypothetical protein
VNQQKEAELQRSSVRTPNPRFIFSAGLASEKSFIRDICKKVISWEGDAMSNRSVLLLTAVMAAMSLSACGGGGGDEEDEDLGPDDASGAGIWLGSYRVDGTTTSLPMRGVVTEEGDYALISFDGTQSYRQFFGTGTTNGNSFSANAVTYLNVARSVPASLQGTVNDRVSINGSFSMNGQSATFTLAYQSALYERAASLATLAGSYSATNGATGTVISAVAEASGAITLTYSQPVGCVLAGTVSVPRGNRNYYRMTGTYNAACAPRSGPMTALIYMDDVAPGQNNRMVILGQLQAQTFSEYVPPTK